MKDQLQAIFESIVQGNREEVEAGVRAAIEQGVPPSDILSEGLIAPMTEVGARFERQERTNR